MQAIVQYIEKIEKLKTCAEYSEARSLIEQCLKRYQDDYRLYEELADVYLYEGDVDKAQRAVEYAQTLSPESATGLYLQGYIYLVNNQYSKGVALLSRANMLTPNNPEILRNLGWGYVMLGQTDRGIIMLKRALNLNPDDELIIEDLGRALLIQGDVQAGETYLRKIGKDAPVLQTPVQAESDA